MKTKGLRKTANQVNSNRVSYYRIYTDSKEVFAGEYGDPNSYTVFDDSSITCIGRWSPRQGRIRIKDIEEMINTQMD